MKCCKSCYWWEYSLDGIHVYKCRLNPDKRFNHLRCHGQFCRDYIPEKDVWKINKILNKEKES